MDFVKSFHDCQTHANLNHVLPSELYSMTFPWPFSIWGIDVIGRSSLSLVLSSFLASYNVCVRDGENLGAFRKGCRHWHLPFSGSYGVATYFIREIRKLYKL